MLRACSKLQLSQLSRYTGAPQTTRTLLLYRIGTRTETRHPFSPRPSPAGTEARNQLISHALKQDFRQLGPSSHDQLEDKPVPQTALKRAKQ